MVDKPTPPKADNAGNDGSEPVTPPLEKQQKLETPPPVGSDHENVRDEVIPKSGAEAVAMAHTISDKGNLDSTGSHVLAPVEIIDPSKPDGKDTKVKAGDTSETGDVDETGRKKVGEKSGAESELAEDAPKVIDATRKQSGKTATESDTAAEKATDDIIKKLPQDLQAELSKLPPNARAEFAKSIEGKEAEVAKKLDVRSLRISVNKYNAQAKVGEVGTDSFSADGLMRSINAEDRTQAKAAPSKDGDTTHGTTPVDRQTAQRATPPAAAEVPVTATTPKTTGRTTAPETTDRTITPENTVRTTPPETTARSAATTTGDLPVTKRDTTIDTPVDPRAAQVEARNAAQEAAHADAIDRNTGGAVRVEREPTRPEVVKPEVPTTPDTRAKLDVFEPKPGAYNPVSVPGFADEQVGLQHSSERAAKYDENYGIDFRDVVSSTSKDNIRTLTYKGEIESSAVGSTDTAFTATETMNKNKLESRSITYEKGLEVTFDTPDGPKKIKDVKQVDTKYDAANDRYETTIKSVDGTEHRALVRTDGTVESFEQTISKQTLTNDKGQKTEVWQDKSGQIVQIQDGKERWTQVRGTDNWVRQNDKGEFLDKDNKVVANAEQAASFKGKIELNADGSITRTDTGTHQTYTKFKDGSSQRTIGNTTPPEFTIKTSAKGDVSMDSKCGTFSVADKTMKVEPDGSISFKDAGGNHVLKNNGDLESTFTKAPRAWSHTVRTLNANGEREIQSITFENQVEINNVNMAGTWTRQADGTLRNGDKTFNGNLKLNETTLLTIEGAKDGQGNEGKGTLRPDGSTALVFRKPGEDKVQYTRMGYTDGSMVDRRPLDAEQIKALGPPLDAEGYIVNEITQTDANNNTFKLYQATKYDKSEQVHGIEHQFVGRVEDQNGRTWVLEDPKSNQWNEVDAKGKPVLGPNGEQNTFVGNFGIRETADGSIVTRQIGSSDGKSFTPDFFIDYHSSGRVVVTNQEIPMIPYASDATIGPTVRLDRTTGDVTLTSVNTKDQLTIKANGDVVASDLALKPFGMTGVTEGVDQTGKKYVKEVTLDGSSGIGPGAGTWRRVGDSSSNEWQQIDASGKPTGKTFAGNFEMQSRLFGSMTVTDAAKHTRDSVGLVEGTQSHEQFNEKNELLSSFEKQGDNSTITKNRIEDAAELKRLGLDSKTPVERVVTTDANGKQITYYEAKDANGYPYTVRYDGAGGSWLRNGDSKSTEFKRVVAGTNDKGEQVWKETGETFYGNIKRSGRQAIFENSRDNQRTVYNSDGTYTRELLTERTEVSSDLKMTPIREAEYTIRTNPSGHVTVIDNNTGRSYSSAVEGANRLSVDDNGDMSFKDGNGRTITIGNDGSRTIVDSDGNSLRTDAGGRMLQQKDKDGKIVASYNYTQEGDKVQLTSFENSSGFWKMNKLPDGRQHWELANGENGGTISLEADKIYMNRDNSMVIERGNTRTVRKLDGTEINSVTTDGANGEKETTVTVGTREGDTFSSAYTVKTQLDRNGKVIGQELISNTEHAKLQSDGTWVSTKANGEVSTWVGQLYVDDSGSLKKITFESVKDQNGKLVAKLDANGQQRVSDTLELRTDGTSTQRYTNGALVERDEDGDVRVKRNASGEQIEISYSNTSPKEIQGFIQGDTYWKLDKTSGRYFATKADKPDQLIDRLNDANVFVTIDSKSGDIVRKNLTNGDVNISRVDGTTELQRKDGSVVITDSAGRPIKNIDANKNEFDLTYDSSGKLMLIRGKIRAGEKDGVPQYMDMIVADESYKGELPPGALRGKDLKIEGFDDRYLSFNSKGHRFEVYPDKTIREYSGTRADSKLIRVDNPDGTTIVSKDYDRSESNRAGMMLPTLKMAQDRGKLIEATEIIAAPKTDHDQLTALGRGNEIPPQSKEKELEPNDHSVVFRTENGALVQQWSDGSSREFETVKQGDGRPDIQRMTKSTDVAGNTTTYEYKDAAKPTAPTKITTTSKADGSVSMLERDPLTDKSTWTVGGEKLAIQSFNVNADGKIMVKHEENSSHPRFMEFMDLRDGSKKVIWKDRSETIFDSQNRMTQRRDTEGRNFTFKYEGNDRTPSVLTNKEGEWRRTAPKPPEEAKAGENTTWVHSENKYEWTGVVSTEGGEYKFRSQEGKTTVANADGTETSTYPDGTVEVTKDGRTLSATDTTGRTSVYEYDGDSIKSFKITDRYGNEIADSRKFTSKLPGETAIIQRGATGLPEIVFSPSNQELTMQANGLGVLRHTEGNETKITGVFRPQDQTLVLARNVDKISLVQPGDKIEVINKDGTKEHFRNDGTRVLFDKDNKTIETQSADGKTRVVFDYATDLSGAKVLNGYTRTSSENGVTTTTKLIKDTTTGKFVEYRGTGDKVLEKTGSSYTSISTWDDQIYLYDRVSKSNKTIESNGKEWEINRHAEDRFTRIERDELGRVTSVQDENFNITHFIRDEKGDLREVIQGETKLYKSKSGTWVSEQNPDLQIHVEKGGPQVTHNGDQIWRDTSGNVRIARADGSVELPHKDGSKTIISPDGNFTTTIYAPGSDIISVKAGKNGSVQVTKADGEVLTQSAYSDLIQSNRKGEPYKGSLEVGSDGRLTVFTDEDNRADVYWSNGAEKHLKLEVTGDINSAVNRAIKDPTKASEIAAAIKENPARIDKILEEHDIDPYSAEGRALMTNLRGVIQYRDGEDIYNTVAETGGVGPYRRDNEFRMSDAATQSNLDKGLESLHRSTYNPSAETSTSTPTGSQGSTVPSGPATIPPPDALGVGSKPPEQTAPSTTVNENILIVERALQSETRADGTKPSPQELRELSQQIAQNPDNASNLLREAGFGDSTVRQVADRVGTNIDTANDSYKDDIVKNALKEAGVEPGRIDSIAAAIARDPAKADQILAESGVSADKIPAVVAKITSDTAAVDKAADTIIRNNLDESGKIPPDKYAEITQRIKDNPDQAVRILQEAGLSKAQATVLANEIKQDLRSFNQLRESVSDQTHNASTAYEVALEAYNDRSKLAGALAKHSVDASAAAEITRNVTNEIKNDSVTINPVSDGRVVTPAQNGTSRVIENAGHISLTSGDPPKSDGTRLTHNGGEAAINTLRADDAAAREALVRRNQEIDTDPSKKVAVDAARIEAQAKEEARAAEISRQAREDQIREQQKQTEIAQQKRAEQERVEQQQRETRERVEREQREANERREADRQREIERREKVEREQSERVQKEQRAELERAQKREAETRARLDSERRELERARADRSVEEQKKELERTKADKGAVEEKTDAPGDATTKTGTTTKPDEVVVGRDGTTGAPADVHTAPGTTGDAATGGTTDVHPKPGGSDVVSGSPDTTETKGGATPINHADVVTGPGSTTTDTTPPVSRDTAGGDTTTVPGTKTPAAEAPAGSISDTGSNITVDKVATPGSTTTLPDSGTTTTDTAPASPGGTTTVPPVVSRDGAGNVVTTDGTIKKADGTVIKADGTVTTPDGTVIKPDGTVTKAEQPGSGTKLDTTNDDNDTRTPVVPPVVAGGEVTPQTPATQTTVPVEGSKLDRVSVPTGTEVVAAPGKVLPAGSEKAVDTTGQPGTVATTTNTTANQGGTPPAPVPTTPAAQEPATQAPPPGSGTQTVPPTGQTAPITPNTPTGQTTPTPDPLNRTTVDPNGPVTTVPAGQPPQTQPSGQQTTTPPTGNDPATTTTTTGTNTTAQGTGTPPAQSTTPGQGQPQTPAGQTGGEPPVGQTTGTVPGTATSPPGQTGSEPPAGQTTGTVPGTTPAANPPVATTGGQTPPQPTGQTDPLNRTTTDPSGTVITPGSQQGQVPAGQTPTGQNPPGTPTGQTTPTTGTGPDPAGQTPAGQTPAGQTPAGQGPGSQTPGTQAPPATPDQTLPKTSTDPATGTTTVPGQSTGQTPAAQPPGSTSGQTTPSGQSPPTGPTTPTGQTTPAGQPTTGQEPGQGQPPQTPAGQTPANPTPGGHTGTTTEPGQTTGTGQTQPAPGQSAPTIPATGQTPIGQTGTEPAQNLPKQSDPNSAPTGQLPGQTTPTAPGQTAPTTPGQTVPPGSTGTGQAGQTLPSSGTPGQEPGQTPVTVPNGQTTPSTVPSTPGQGTTGTGPDPQGNTGTGTTTTDPQGPTGTGTTPTVPAGQTGQTLPTGQLPPQNSTTTDPSSTLPKVSDPNAPATSTTTGTTTGTTPTGTQVGNGTAATQVGSGTAPAGTGATTGTTTTAQGTTDPNAATTPAGPATTTGSQTTNAASTGTGTATQTTQNAQGSPTSGVVQADPNSTTAANATGNSTAGNATVDPSGALSANSGTGSVTMQDLRNQIATSAVVVAVLNNLAHSGQGQSYYQQRPNVDPGSTTVTTHVPSSTTTTNSYSEPASSGTTTYSTPTHTTNTSTYREPTPSTPTHSSSTTISTGTSTTPTQSQNVTVAQPATSAAEPNVPPTSSQSSHSEPQSQPSREPVVSSSHQTTQTQNTQTTPTTTQPVLQSSPSSHNSTTGGIQNAQSIQQTAQQTTQTTGHQQTTGQEPQIQPAQSHSTSGSPGQTAGQTQTQSTQTHPVQTQSTQAQTSTGNTDDEHGTAHGAAAAAAAAHASAQQPPSSAEPASNSNTTTPNTQTQTTQRQQQQHQPANVQQQQPARQHSSTQGTHSSASQQPLQQAAPQQPSTGSASGTTSNSQQGQQSGNSADPNATAAANAQAQPVGPVQAKGANDPSLQNNGPNDPNSVDPTSADPTAVSVITPQDPSQTTQDPGQSSPDPTQDPQQTTQTQQVEEEKNAVEERPTPKHATNDVDVVISSNEPARESQLHDFTGNVHAETDEAVVDNTVPHTDKAAIEAQVEAYFDSYKSAEPPFVDMSGDRVIEKHMPDGTTLLTFTDGVSAWVKGEQVTVIDSEGDISSFKGHVDSSEGHVTIYDANDVVIHTTVPEFSQPAEKPNYTFVIADGEDTRQVSIPADWSISFGVDGGQIVHDTRGNVMMIIDGDGSNVKYVGPEEFKATYGQLNGDLTIIDSTTGQQLSDGAIKPVELSSASKVTLLDFNPGGAEGSADSLISQSSSSSASTSIPNVDPASFTAPIAVTNADLTLPIPDPITGPVNSQISEPQIDLSMTQDLPVDVVAGKPIDPTTGLPYDPDTGKLLDPTTGHAIGDYIAPADNVGIGIMGDGSLLTPVDNTIPPVVVGQGLSAEQGVLDNQQFSPVDAPIADSTTDGADAVAASLENNATFNGDGEDSRNLEDILNDEIIRIHDNIESRLEEIRNNVHGTRMDNDVVIASFDPDAPTDISSRIDDIEKIADEHEQARQDRIKEEDERKRDEEEERLKKRKEQIKKLADTMQAIVATKRREEMERVRKLLEQQRKIEEFITQDTRQTKYTVRYGDTLESIAKKMFKDPRVAHLIYDMNKTKVTVVEMVDGKPRYQVKPGTELKLPSPRQAREWVMRGKYMQVDETVAQGSARTLSDKEKAELDDRRKNVESVLGAIGYAAADAAEGGIKYNVRLGDSLRSVAMKHPMLNDVSLWRLLAEKNNLPVTTDNHGIPTAILKRGTKLIMPTKQEIVEFRKKLGVLTHPASTWLNDASTDGPESSRTSKKCADCKRQAPIGVSICPSCGHIFEAVPSVPVAKMSFTVVTKPPKPGIETKDDAITVDAPRKDGIKTKDENGKDPLVETADDNKVVDLSELAGVPTNEENADGELDKTVIVTTGGVRTRDESDKSSVPTTQENKPYISTDPGYSNGVPTEEDRTVFVAHSTQADGDSKKAIDQSSAITQELGDYEQTIVVKDGIVTAQLPEENDSTIIVSGVPKQPIVDGVSASESLLQGISSLHKRDTTDGAQTGNPASQQLHVERFTEQLSETCRLVQLDSSRANKRSTRLQLEVLREGKWISVVAYEIAAEKSVRHEYSLSGKTKSMKMDLPSGALEAMVQNDLTRNWKAYCEKFLNGKKISA